MLIVILVVGYAVDALRDDGGTARPRTTTTASAAPTVGPSSTVGQSASSSATAVGVPLSGLPTPARRTVALIKTGGPFPYDRDGVVFRNDERRLPVKASGYYHEYTVATPGEDDRGARRIIMGKAGEYYYTADHYETFVRVDVNR